MAPAIVAAIIAGSCAIAAALLQIYVKAQRRKKETMELPSVSHAEGLSAVVGIVQKDQQILMVKRKKRIGEVAWQFPAGVVKPGEVIRDRVEEEVRIETGITCRYSIHLGSRIHADTHVLCHYIHCVYLHGEAQNLDPNENSDVQWVNANDVKSYSTSNIFGEVERLLKKIEQGKNVKTALALVHHNGRFLMVQAKLPDGTLSWRFPGGKVEVGESESQAACREVYEETGVKCSPSRRLGERIHPTTKLPTTYYICDYLSGDLTVMEPSQFQQVTWMSPREISENVTDSIFQPAMDHIRSFAQ